MIAARITMVQAFVTLAIAASGLVLAYYVNRHSKKNRYPAKLAMGVIAMISLWLIINVFDDRTTSIPLNIIFSQIAYFVPLTIFYLFTNFALRFPPASEKKAQRFWNYFNLLIVVTAGLIIFSPSGLVEYFDFTAQKLLINLSPYYYVVMASYLAQLFGIAIILLRKWQRLSRPDKRVVALIAGSLFVTALIGLSLDTAIALTSLTVSSFIYAYLATLIFMLAFAYAILRYGALDVGISVSRNVLYWGAVTTPLILFSYLYWLAQNRLPLNLELSARATLIVSLGLVSYFVIEVVFDRYLKKHNQPEPFKPFSGTENFLTDIKNKYHLTWCRWYDNDATDDKKSQQAKLIQLIGPKKTRARRGHLTLFNKHIYHILQKIYPRQKNLARITSGVALNSIDVNRRTLIDLQARPFRDAGPERISIIITTRKGTFIAGHKKYNLAFSEPELKLMRHEINLHRAQLEIRDIKEARANHVHQLEHLSNVKKSSLQKANQQLKENLTRRAKFFRNIAMELRTPLTIIQATLSENTLGLPAKQLAVLADNNRRLLNLTKELQLVGGGHPAIIKQLQEINLQDIGRAYRMRYATQLKRRRLRLKFFVFPLKAKIWINPTHFEQIMDNLLSNAIKYSPPATTITTHIKVYPGRLLLQVSDQGPGIKKSEQNLVFEPFFRTSEVKNIKGTGLGLSTVKRLATLYQGRARVKANAEHGSTFEVDINVRTEIPPIPAQDQPLPDYMEHRDNDYTAIIEEDS